MLGNADFMQLRHDGAVGDFFLHLGDSPALQSVATIFEDLGADVEVDRRANRLVIHRPSTSRDD